MLAARGYNPSTEEKRGMESMTYTRAAALPHGCQPHSARRSGVKTQL